MKHLRFFASLLPGVFCLALLFGVIALVTSRIQGFVGVGIGVAAGACLVFGLLLVYYNAVDWLNLRVVRRTAAEGDSALDDGAVVAFSGIVKTEGEPLTSPFSALPCAAYTYVVSSSRISTRGSGSQRVVCAEGFHMVPTLIEGASRSLRVRALPGFEDELRQNTKGGDWGETATELLGRLFENVPSAGELERKTALLEARHTVVEEIRHDYCQTDAPERGDGLTIDEEVLPASETVTMIGTYDAELQALTARRPRLGENLMVYRGAAEDVLARVGGELGWFAKATAIFLLVGALLLSLALLPARWTSKLPLLGPAVVQPSDEAR